jgi:hypothetical protein
LQQAGKDSIGSGFFALTPGYIKEVHYMDRRYIACVNDRQAEKDRKTRETTFKALEEKIPKGTKSLVGNKGYRRYVRIEKDSVSIGFEKVKDEARLERA